MSGGCGAHCAYRTASHATSVAALARHYVLNPAQLPAYLHPAIARLEHDAETAAFLAACRPRWCVDALANLLRSCFSLTDVNGLLARGQMFVLSRAHAAALLAPALAAARAAHGGPLRLLDVGAGDGEVTARLASVVDSVHATEVSAVMARRLRARGYGVSEGPLISRAVLPADGAFDVVTLMNLLDRCDHPREMLADAARLARRGTGRILVALVLPFAEFVEEGVRRRGVRGPLPMGGARCSDGATLETSLAAFVERVVHPLGLEVERLARLPYLCRGDAKQPYYVLSDAILLLRHAVGSSGEDTTQWPRAHLDEACDRVLLLGGHETVKIRSLGGDGRQQRAGGDNIF
jgi:hypothetical protein